MYENILRNQSNVIYGAPCEVIAAGENRNLVQGSEPKVKRYRDPIDELECVLAFGYGEDWKKKTKKQGDKRISQASIPNLGKKLSILERLLKFGGGFVDMPSAAAITTFSKINTEADKKQTILDAVTLTSCDGDTTEQQLKIERLMSIIDDEVLDFVLNEYALPFRDYKEGSRQIGRDTLLDTNQFLHIVGSTSDFLYFCCYYFYIPTEAEIMNEIPPDIIVNKGRLLANGKFNAEGEHR